MQKQGRKPSLPQNKLAWVLTLTGVLSLGIAIYYSLPQILVYLHIKGGAYATDAGMIAFIVGLPAFISAIIFFAICQSKAALKSTVNLYLFVVTLAVFLAYIAFSIYSTQQIKAERNRPITILDPPNQITLQKDNCALTARCNDFAYFVCNSGSQHEIDYFAQQLSPKDSKSYVLIAKCHSKNCNTGETCNQCPPKLWKCKDPAQR